MNNAAIIVHAQVFVWTYVFISLGYLSRSGTAGSYYNFMSNILRNCHSEAVSIPTSGFGKVKGHVKRQGQGHLTLMSCFLVLETK